MNKKVLMIIFAALIIVLLNSGCASYAVHKHYKDDMIQARAVNNGAVVGVDLLGTMSEHPFASLSAALVDAATAYGAYTVYDNSKSNNDESDKPNSSGRDTIVIHGNGNNVNTSSSITMPTEAPVVE